MKTFKELLKEGTQILINGGIEEARLDAWLLLEYTADITRAWYYAHMDDRLDAKTEERYRTLCTTNTDDIVHIIKLIQFIRINTDRRHSHSTSHNRKFFSFICSCISIYIPDLVDQSGIL